MSSFPKWLRCWEICVCLSQTKNNVLLTSPHIKDARSPLNAVVTRLGLQRNTEAKVTVTVRQVQTVRGDGTWEDFPLDF